MKLDLDYWKKRYIKNITCIVFTVILLCVTMFVVNYFEDFFLFKSYFLLLISVLGFFFGFLLGYFTYEIIVTSREKEAYKYEKELYELYDNIQKKVVNLSKKSNEREKELYRRVNWLIKKEKEKGTKEDGIQNKN